MGIRRRRRKLTTLIGNLSQRMKSVELRPISLLTEGQIQSTLEAGELAEGPTAAFGVNAPNEFRRIEDAYVYPRKLTGLTEDRVEIYLEADLNINVGETLQVSGIHGTSTVNIDVSSENFKVRASDTPPWTGRTLPKGQVKDDPAQDQRAGVVITNAYSFKPETVAPVTWNQIFRLQTKRQIDTFAISGTTVTLVMNAVHKFKVGDIVSINIFAADSRAFGTDGLFVIDSVTSTTIVYKLDAGVDTPVTPTVPASPVFVFPVARKFLAVGSTWQDPSDNSIYYWDGIRWVDYSTVASPIQDGDPPARPTGLSATSTALVSTTTLLPYARVRLTWTAPTKTAAGKDLTDLVGYTLQWRTSPSDDWSQKDLKKLEDSSHTYGEETRLLQGQLYYFRLFAYDSGQQPSLPIDITHTTPIKAGNISVFPPTDPIVISRLGTVRVSWNGQLRSGPSATIPSPSDVTLLKIYLSTVINFTPSPANFIASTRVSGAAGGFEILTDLEYGISYYIRISVVNSSGTESPASAQVTAMVLPLVDTDLIASTLTTWPFAGQVVPPGSLADGSLNAASLFGPNVITQDAISANAIGVNELAANSVVAGKIAADAVTANTIAALAIQAGAINVNSITADKINAGAITAVKINSGAITTEKIFANAITGDKINVGAITADKIDATAISAFIFAGREIRLSAQSDNSNPKVSINKDRIAAFNSANKVTLRIGSDGDILADDITINDGKMTGNLSVAGTVTGGSFSGGSFTTAGAGKRVLLSSSSNSLVFFDGDEAGRISAGGAGNQMIYQTSSTTDVHSFRTGATTIFSINNDGISVAPGKTISGQGNIGFNAGINATGSIQSDSFIRSGNGSTGTATLHSNGGISANGGASPSVGQITSGTSIKSGTTVIVGSMNSSSTASFVRWNGADQALLVNSSDRRIKSNIETISEGLSIVNQLNPITFDSLTDDNDKRSPGFIAQEVEEIFSGDVGVVSEIHNGSIEQDIDLSEGPLKTLNYESLIPYLTKAVQELSAKNDDLEERLAKMEKDALG